MQSLPANDTGFPPEEPTTIPAPPPNTRETVARAVVLLDDAIDRLSPIRDLSDAADRALHSLVELRWVLAPLLATFFLVGCGGPAFVPSETSPGDAGVDGAPDADACVATATFASCIDVGRVGTCSVDDAGTWIWCPVRVDQ